MTNMNMDWNNEKPLGKVTCSSHDCERDLHSFRRRGPGGESYRNEQCVACGAQLIDWNRLDQHDCQGRREIRPCGGAKVYHLSGDVQRKCPPTTGVVGSP